MKLFVARLPQSATAESLRSLFEAHGEVKDSKVIIDRDTGHSKGYAFVEMQSAEAAHVAIEKLNGYLLDGKSIHVKVSDPTPEKKTDQRSFRNSPVKRWDMHASANRYGAPYSRDEHGHPDTPLESPKHLRPRRKRIQP